eukprot:Em0010g774a
MVWEQVYKKKRTKTPFNIKSCVKSLFGTVSMEMRRNITRGHSCIWFCTGEEQHQEPNAETDHPECSTPPGISTLGSTNLLKYPYVPQYSAGMPSKPDGQVC